jgi:hypothetical protein
MLALTAVLIVALTACTRGGSAANSSPSQVYAASPNQTDVRSLLGSGDWWESTPSFGVRPLGLPEMSEAVRFSITDRFIRIGTSEFFVVQYMVYNTTSDATSEMTTLSNNLPNSATSPKAGDQSIYTGQKSAGKSSLYTNLAFVRVGSTIISIEWDRNQGFTDANTLAKIGNHLASKLKDVTSGKIKPSPSATTADMKLLPPAGTDVTLVGVARLPVEAAVASLGIPSPQPIVDAFHQLGVKDFVFGDYALNADLTMEVRAYAFTFSSPDDATSWLDGIVGGASNLDANGVASGYATGAGFYYAFFTGGTHGAMLFCSSLDPLTAAARACEAPMGDLIGSWQLSLSQA